MFPSTARPAESQVRRARPPRQSEFGVGDDEVEHLPGHRPAVVRPRVVPDRPSLPDVPALEPVAPTASPVGCGERDRMILDCGKKVVHNGAGWALLLHNVPTPKRLLRTSPHSLSGWSGGTTTPSVPCSTYTGSASEWSWLESWHKTRAWHRVSMPPTSYRRFF